MSIPRKRRHAFAHFSQRTAERLGREVDAMDLWRWIINEITDNGPGAKFAGRLYPKCRRAWIMTHPDHGRFTTVFDHDAGIPITVLSQGQPIKCGASRRTHIIDGEAYVL